MTVLFVDEIKLSTQFNSIVLLAFAQLTFTLFEVGAHFTMVFTVVDASALAYLMVFMLLAPLVSNVTKLLVLFPSL